MKGSYSWYASFVNAILELDQTRVAHRVDIPRRAIDQRIDDIENKGELLSTDERQAIDDALSELRVIERGSLGRSRQPVASFTRCDEEGIIEATESTLFPRAQNFSQIVLVWRT